MIVGGFSRCLNPQYVDGPGSGKPQSWCRLTATLCNQGQVTVLTAYIQLQCCLPPLSLVFFCKICFVWHFFMFNCTVYKCRVTGETGRERERERERGRHAAEGPGRIQTQAATVRPEYFQWAIGAPPSKLSWVFLPGGSKSRGQPSGLGVGHLVNQCCWGSVCWRGRTTSSFVSATLLTFS